MARYQRRPLFSSTAVVNEIPPPKWLKSFHRWYMEVPCPIHFTFSVKWVENHEAFFGNNENTSTSIRQDNPCAASSNRR
jgi:hypothetical protein